MTHRRPSFFSLFFYFIFFCGCLFDIPITDENSECENRYNFFFCPESEDSSPFFPSSNFAWNSYSFFLYSHVLRMQTLWRCFPIISEEFFYEISQYFIVVYGNALVMMYEALWHWFVFLHSRFYAHFSFQCTDSPPSSCEYPAFAWIWESDNTTTVITSSLYPFGAVQFNFGTFAEPLSSHRFRTVS